jgi:hypothetical protein
LRNPLRTLRSPARSSIAKADSRDGRQTVAVDADSESE